MPRVVIEIPVDVIEKLDSMAQKQAISRTELLKTALCSLVEKKDTKKLTRGVFGILKSKKIDGLKLQQQLRDEW